MNFAARPHDRSPAHATSDRHTPTGVRHARLALAACALVAAAQACGSEAHAQEPKPADAATARAATQAKAAKDAKGNKPAAKSAPDASRPASFFGDWFAAGSGCKATHKKAGDVSFEPIGITADAPSAIRGRILLKDYKLSSPPSDPKTSIAFARECNVRLQVTPPPGKRVRGVSARTTWVASKDAPVKLQLQNTLYMDTSIVGASFTEVPEGEKVANREFEVVLTPGRFVGVPEQPQVEKTYECGAMVVFGSDFTAIAHRKEKSDSALVRAAGADRALEFAVELEDCSPK